MINFYDQLRHVEEAFTTEHWIVRIYKVKKPVNKSKKLSHKPVQRKTKTRGKKKGKKGVLKVKVNQQNGVKTRQASSDVLKL